MTSTPALDRPPARQTWNDMAEERASVRRRAVILGGALLLSYAYFYQGGGWGQNTRLDLVRALVEQHTVFIDDYADNTGDLACANGHELLDKAPGTSFVAAPPACGVASGPDG